MHSNLPLSRLPYFQFCLGPDYHAFKFAYVQENMRSNLAMSRLCCVQICLCPYIHAFRFSYVLIFNFQLFKFAYFQFFKKWFLLQRMVFWPHLDRLCVHLVPGILNLDLGPQFIICVE